MSDAIYHRASSVDDAASLASGGEDAKFLAGGMTLIPTIKQRLADPSDLIDVGRIDAMRGITVNGKSVTIGAATTHAEVARSSELRSVCPALSDLASHIGDPHVRNRGTIGGSVANNDPAADYPAAMLGLNAQIKTNKRTLSADDFFVGLFETALEEGELVVSVSFDAPDQCGYSKFRNPASRYAMAGVFVANGADGVRVAVTGAGNDGVFRHSEMESALGSNFSADAIAGCSVDTSMIMSDLHGDANYRANLVKVMAKRAVQAAS